MGYIQSRGYKLSSVSNCANFNSSHPAKPKTNYMLKNKKRDFRKKMQMDFKGL